MVDEWWYTQQLQQEVQQEGDELAHLLQHEPQVEPITWRDTHMRAPKRHVPGQVVMTVHSVRQGSKRTRTTKKAVLPDDHPLVLHWKRVAAEKKKGKRSGEKK